MHKRSTTLFLRVTSLTLVIMLSLASGRSFIPGLCATQSALESRCDGAVSCCDRSELPTDGQPIVQANSDVACAFCSLATTLVTASSAIQFETTFAPTLVRAIVADGFVGTDAIDQTHAGRAPPVASV